jgi:hypothetical protein
MLITERPDEVFQFVFRLLPPATGSIIVAGACLSRVIG